MSRKPRIHIPEGFYHVMLRGNAGHDIFFKNEDREKFYELLEEGTKRYGYLVHAFCLMSNHVHLLVQQGPHTLSKPLQNISFRYAKWINKTQNRMGHLFQGRYTALLIEKDSYFLQLIKYIHLNPIRAKIVSSPEQYKWSSHLAYLGLQIIPWLTIDVGLSQFSDDISMARRKYLEHIRQGLAEANSENFEVGNSDRRILGDEKFTKQAVLFNPNETLLKSYYTIEQVINFVCAKFNTNYESLKNKSRNRYHSEARFIIVWLCSTLEISTITEISKLLNRDPTNYMRLLRKITDDEMMHLEMLRADFVQKLM